MKIDLVVGARPNIVKAAAILEAAKKFPQLEIQLVHTGQHDMHSIMSEPHFRDLGLPQPDCYHILKMATGMTSADRLGRMVGFVGSVIVNDGPDVVMVVGDTDSTLAGALAAVKSGVPYVHVEAGLRCHDRRMQEEINRILVDSLAARLYTTSRFADANLAREGRIGTFVGNVMVDTLMKNIARAKALYPVPETAYALFTLHRAENVDDTRQFGKILNVIDGVSNFIPVVWPTHPRAGKLDFFYNPAITRIPPAGYLEFISLLANAQIVLTDSGGVQEEATALGIPCLTLRESTERPETVMGGSNFIVGDHLEEVVVYAHQLVGTTIDYTQFKPDGYDGHAAERLLEDLCHATL